MTDFWQRCPVLVTGISGLLGRALARYLSERGAQVVGLSRQPERARSLTGAAALPASVVLASGSLESPAALQALLARYEPRVLFHLAGQSSVREATLSPLATFTDNVLGTTHALEAARGATLRPLVILASTLAVHGARGFGVCQENAPLAPAGAYAVSKVCAEAIGRVYAETHGLSVGVVRPTQLYGPGEQHAERLVASLVRAARGEPAAAIEAPPEAAFDLLYVADAAVAFGRVAEWLVSRPATWEAFNLSSGRLVSVAELRALLAELQRASNPAAGTAPVNDPASKAWRLLGWQPRTDLMSGLARTLREPTQVQHD